MKLPILLGFLGLNLITTTSAFAKCEAQVNQLTGVWSAGGIDNPAKCLGKVQENGGTVLKRPMTQDQNKSFASDLLGAKKDGYFSQAEYNGLVSKYKLDCEYPKGSKPWLVGQSISSVTNTNKETVVTRNGIRSIQKAATSNFKIVKGDVFRASFDSSCKFQKYSLPHVNNTTVTAAQCTKVHALVEEAVNSKGEHYGVPPEEFDNKILTILGIKSREYGVTDAILANVKANCRGNTTITQMIGIEKPSKAGNFIADPSHPEGVNSAY